MKQKKQKIHKVKGKVHLNTKEQCIICSQQSPALSGGLR